MAFNPNDYLISLKGKKYLQVAHRLMWFREEHPRGTVATDVVSIDPLICKATILDVDNRILGTGHGSATVKPNAVWSGREVEKAETAAIGRALAAAGFGTQFTESFDEGEHLADSPTEPAPRPATAPKQAEPAPTGANTPEQQKTAFTPPSDEKWWTDRDEIARVRDETGITAGLLLSKIGAQFSDFPNADGLINKWRAEFASQ